MANIVVSSGSTVTVSTATSSSYTVDGGGTLVVSATVSGGATVSSGGVIELFGGNISGTTDSGGYVVVSGGNFLAGTTTVSGGGTIELQTSGATISGSLNFGAGSNTLLLDKVLSSGSKGVGSATIGGFSGDDTIVVLGGYSGDTISYSNGGDTVTLSATAGKQAFNFSSSVQNDFDLLTSPSIPVNTPGSAATTSAGVELTFGSNVTVGSGAELYVYSGGSATDDKLMSGGTIDLTNASATLAGTLTFSGGSNDLLVAAVAATGDGDQAVISGFGSTDKIDITAIASAGATMSFSTGGGNEVVTVANGGSSESFIFSGTTAYTSNTIELTSDGSGDAELVLATGGIITSVTTSTSSGAYNVASGNTLLVLSGGSISAAEIASAAALIVNGGVDVAAILSAGATETVSSGSASLDQIFGAATVLANGAVTSETVSSGGSLTISGTDTSATVLSGGVEKVFAGSATGDQIYGTLTVSGATISNETVESGGSATLNAGAIDSDMTVLAGGTLIVSAATGSAVSQMPLALCQIQIAFPVPFFDLGRGPCG